MTLRHRLLLVYLIVVLLSVATVGVAIFELEQSRQIYGALQPWNDLAIAAQRLASVLASPDAADERGQSAFLSLLVSQYPRLAEAGEHWNVDRVREALNTLNRRFQAWRDHVAAGGRQPPDEVHEALRQYSQLVDDGLLQLRAEAARQETRKYILLAAVVVLTVVHIMVIGSLLRRWLIRPMERLGRQVEALGRDQPPPEPLLTAPQEMAALAEALDRARQSLAVLRRQLLDAERMTTIGQFAAQLAHNLRNPLATIRAMAQLAARRARQDPEIARQMEEIVASVDRMNNWIAGLMEAARPDKEAARRGDVTPVLERVARAVQPELAAKELRLDLRVPPGGVVCLHDPAILEHALIAMLTNAVEASPLGQTIVLQAEPLPPTDRITETSCGQSRSPGPRADAGETRPTTSDTPDTPPPAGQHSPDLRCGQALPPGRTGVCRISVRDRGTGLPADDPERIFAFSYSTKQKGMGLGLALARQAVERLGGQAHAFNNPDGGATVYIDLPM